MTPRVEVTVRGLRRSVQIEAVIDTGFAGAFCLPMDVAARIGVEVCGWGGMRLANGIDIRALRVYCDVELLGVVTRVEAFITDAFDPLIGTELLENCQMSVDFDSGALQLTRKSP